MTGSIESWRAVVGFEGFYEISDHGNLRSLDRVVLLSNGHVRRYRGRAISPGFMPTGHLSVSMTKSGERWTSQIHRLVMQSFVGPRSDGMEVRHLDGNPANNHLANLAYGTKSENRIDRIRHGADHNASKTHCKWGHAFDKANTYHRPGGGRRCRRCKSNAERSRRAMDVLYSARAAA